MIRLFLKLMKKSLKFEIPILLKSGGNGLFSSKKLYTMTILKPNELFLAVEKKGVFAVDRVQSLILSSEKL